MKIDPRLVATGAALLAIAGAVFGRNPHPLAWWEEIPAYGALLGYCGAWGLIGLSKGFLAPLLHRDDDETEES